MRTERGTAEAPPLLDGEFREWLERSGDRDLIRGLEADARELLQRLGLTWGGSLATSTLREKAAAGAEATFIVRRAAHTDAGSRRQYYRLGRYLASRPHLLPLVLDMVGGISQEHLHDLSVAEARENVCSVIVRARRLIRRMRYGGTARPS